MGSHRAPDRREEPDRPPRQDPGPVAPETQDMRAVRPPWSTETSPAPQVPPPLRRGDPPLAQGRLTVPAGADDHLSGGGRPVDTVLPEAPVYPDTRGAPVDWHRRPGKPESRPEPVLNAAKIAGALAGVILAIGGLLRLIGVVDIGDAELQRVADDASSVVLTVGVLWATVGPWVLARWRARPRVTPLSDPRDARGRRLVPED